MSLFTGLIDEVRLYNSALSGAEVQAIYASTIIVNAVPEPASLALLSVGMLGLLSFCSRRKSTAADEA